MYHSTVHMLVDCLCTEFLSDLLWIHNAVQHCCIGIEMQLIGM